MSRDSTLADSVSSRRRKLAVREAAQFSTFCTAYGLGEEVESISLYLANHADTESGAATRRRLQYLDLVRRLSGQPPWSADDDLRALLHGLHRDNPIGPPSPGHVDPLYVELVRALIDATRVPTVHQRRAVAAIILHASTGLPAAVLARLTWDQVRLTRKGVAITVCQRVGRGAETHRSWRLRAKPESPDCPVAALMPLVGGHFVLAEKAGMWDEARLRASLEPYDRARPRRALLRSAIEAATHAPPISVRDRALLTIGYGAGLRTYEATGLLQRDVRKSESGLLLRVQGRRAEVGISSAAQGNYDPVQSWTEWQDCMADQRRVDPDMPAFPSCNQSRIGDAAIAAQGLNHVIHRRCEQAGLQGHYAWTSLRTGMVRTAVRHDVREWRIADQADLVSLNSVRRHERRENLLRSNVAGRLGL